MVDKATVERAEPLTETPKLKLHQRRALIALSTCIGPWEAVARKNINALQELADIGLAYRSAVPPHGWIITEAGRLALALEEGY